MHGPYLPPGPRHQITPGASQPTVVLTTSLFDAYTRDPAVGRAAALRTAQLKLLADPATSHPSFWAPFVLVGDGGAP